jgi:serine/threonine protein kinase/tetratricopeptide (TPR) repeat protein
MKPPTREDTLEPTAAGGVLRRRRWELERGSTVGRYVILEQIGAGGMGVVYKAFDPELNRAIALKLMITAKDVTGSFRERLLREAQALARLSHPNVIAIHDVGTFGVDVFMAMEFVEGTTLRHWLREKPRSRREIVDIFLAAGSGLAAAHRVGLVHRDFKPDNVMVGSDGRVRVLDFGLARFVANERHDMPAAVAEAPPPQPSTEETAERVGATVEEGVPDGVSASVGGSTSGVDRLLSPLTHEGAIMGTPRFMAPEQHLGQEVDERSDQFSFCLCLYEALCGDSPFAGETPSATQDNVIFGRIADSSPSARVPGWMRKVLVRGLALAPADRYPSMVALLAALQADPRISRRTWMGRVGVVVLVGLTALVWQRERRQQRVACAGADRKLDGIWDDTRRSAMRAAFLSSGKPYAETVLRTVEHALDEYGHAWAAMHVDACEATHLRHEQSQELLDLRMTCLGDRLTHLKTVTDLYAAADPNVVEHAVESAESMPRLEACADAAALRARVPPPSDGATQQRVADLRRELARANALERAGQLAQGLEIATHALNDAKALRYRPVEAEAELSLAQLRGAHGDYATAVQLLRRAHVDAIAGRDDEGAARAALSLIQATGDRQSHYDEADQWAEIAEGTVERLHRQDELLGELFRQRSFLRICESKYEDALRDAKLALELQQRLFGRADHRVAAAYDNLGTAYYQLAQYAEALDNHQQALFINEEALGADHPVNAVIRIGIGNVYEDMGQHAQALEQHRRALTIYERVNPAHPNVSVIYTSMGNSLSALGRPQEAFEHYRRGFELAEKLTMADDMSSASIGLGDSSLALGRLDEALRYFERALQIGERVLGPTHMMCGFAHKGRAEVYRRMGRLDDARVGFERAAQILEKALGPKHPYLAQPLLGMGRVHLARHQAALAMAPLERAVAIAEARRGDGFELAEIQFALAQARWARGDRPAAVALSAKARDAFGAIGKRGQQTLVEVTAWLDRHQ